MTGLVSILQQKKKNRGACSQDKLVQLVSTLGNRPPLLTIYFVQIAGKKKGTEVGNSFKRVIDSSN